MKLRHSLLTAPLLALQIAGCSTNQAAPVATSSAPMAAASAPAQGRYANLSIEQYRALSQDADFFVVNVHVPFEGDLPGTDATIAFNQIQNQLDKLPQSKSARILLYCKSGGMSATAAKTLVEQGYTGVFNLVGGMNAWTAAGHTLASVP